MGRCLAYSNFKCCCCLYMYFGKILIETWGLRSVQRQMRLGVIITEGPTGTRLQSIELTYRGRLLTHLPSYNVMGEHQYPKEEILFSCNMNWQSSTRGYGRRFGAPEPMAQVRSQRMQEALA